MTRLPYEKHSAARNWSRVWATLGSKRAPASTYLLNGETYIGVTGRHTHVMIADNFPRLQNCAVIVFHQVDIHFKSQIKRDRQLGWDYQELRPGARGQSQHDSQFGHENFVSYWQTPCQCILTNAVSVCRISPVSINHGPRLTASVHSSHESVFWKIQLVA